MALNQFQLAEAYVELKARDTEFNAGLGKVESRLDKLRLKMEAVSRVAKIMFVAGAAAMAYFIKQASDAEEIMSKFDAVFKSGTAEARKWAEELSKSIGRSKIDIQQYMATLQDTFVPLGFARDKSAELSKELTKLGIDLASFNNASEPETINLLTSAIVGNHEAVRRFGISITEATLKQELLNMGFGKGLKVVTEQAKVQARLNIIMRSTSDAQGDAANTADSMANQWKAMTGEIRDLSVELGQAFMPIAKDLVAWARKWIPELANWVRDNKTIVIETAKLTAGVLAFLIVAPKLIAAVGAITAAYKGMAAAQTAAAVGGAGKAAVGAAAGTAGVLSAPVAIGAATAAAGYATVWSTASHAAGEYNKKLERQTELEQKLAELQKQRLSSLKQNLVDAIAGYEKLGAAGTAGLAPLLADAEKREEDRKKNESVTNQDFGKAEEARGNLIETRSRITRQLAKAEGAQVERLQMALEAVNAEIRQIETTIAAAEQEQRAQGWDAAKKDREELRNRPLLAAPTGYGGRTGLETSTSTIDISQLAGAMGDILNARAQEELQREANVQLVEVNSKLDRTNQLLQNNPGGWK